MILKASDVPEDEIMCFSSHRSCEGIRSYSKPTNDQQLSSTATLIPYAAIDEDLEEFYSYLDNIVNDKRVDEDNVMNNKCVVVNECEENQQVIQQNMNLDQEKYNQVQAQAQSHLNLQIQSTHQALNPISPNIILQIPHTDKPLTITLNLKFDI
ncbi:5936_t:CDS:2 [Gigaspora margarita]|uniref:5936_t:CDS:1 n=1 Tax=Gigaspora margarita TaxID=4874 RepID=A0ABN7VR38_GIGMA|nr:5936_t:CDS:2 [Gigaspora margarita]